MCPIAFCIGSNLTHQMNIDLSLSIKPIITTTRNLEATYDFNRYLMNNLSISIFVFCKFQETCSTCSQIYSLQCSLLPNQTCYIYSSNIRRSLFTNTQAIECLPYKMDSKIIQEIVQNCSEIFDKDMKPQQRISLKHAYWPNLIKIECRIIRRNQHRYFNQIDIGPLSIIVNFTCANKKLNFIMNLQQCEFNNNVNL